MTKVGLYDIIKLNQTKRKVGATNDKVIEGDGYMSKTVFVYDEVCDAWECQKCKLLWILCNDGGPFENEMFYCPKCGRKIEREERRDGCNFV